MALPYITSQQSEKIAKEMVAQSQLVVTYTAGEEVKGVYPLSSSHTLEQIAEALAEGRDIVAKVIVNEELTAYPFPIVRNAPDMMMYTAIAAQGDGEIPLFVEVMHVHLEDEPESAFMTMIPLAIAQEDGN